MDKRSTRNENDSSRTSQITLSVEDIRPKKRKRDEDDPPSKRSRVFEEVRPSTSCQDQIRTVRRIKTKSTEEKPGPSPTAKRNKKGLLEEAPTKEKSPSSADESTGSRKRNPKRKAEDPQEPPKRKKTKTKDVEKEQLDPQTEFHKKYVELHLLGDGGYGYVFAGYRIKGKLPVAIKHIPKDKVVLKDRDENGRELASEVTVMLKLRTATVAHSAIVSLLDWYDLDQEVIVVMERPMFADDLLVYLNSHVGTIEEIEAKIILKQLVEAAVYLQNENIFHRDIKLENILMETGSDGTQIYLIDFGLSCFDENKQHDCFYGTYDHIPVDWLINSSYRAGPTTVWQLGVVLFEILHMTRFRTCSLLTNNIVISERLSSHCQDFLIRCLRVNPEARPTLEELLHHPWFS